MTDRILFTLRVDGTPIPQGSKTRGRHSMYDDNAATLKPWRAALQAAAEQEISMLEDFARIEGPVAARITFTMRRLKSHYGTGRNAGILKPTAPVYQCTIPDVDKLTRAVFDSLTKASVWKDDGQVAALRADKIYGERPGIDVTLRALAVTP